MMKQWMKSAFLLPLCLCWSAVAQENAWEQFDYPPINSFEMPEMELFELDNGIRFYLVEDDELPLVRLNVMVRTGGVLVPDDKVGLNRVAGTVMRSGGSEQYPAEELNRMLEDRAAVMETSIGFTSGRATMNVLSEDMEFLLPVFVDLLVNPRFPQERINLAITQEETAISRRNDEQGDVARREFQRVIYGEGSKYARRIEYATLANITRQDIVDFHASSFVGANMMIGVVGDFETEAMKARLEEAFGDIPRGEQAELEFPPVDYEFEPGVHFVDKSDVNQSYILMGHIGGMRDNPDYAALQVMNRVLSGGFSSRLMQEVRSELGLAYSVFGSYGSGQYFPGTFTAGVMTASESTAEATEAVIREIRRLRVEPVSDEELAQTMDEFLNSLVFQYTSRGDVLAERMENDYAGMPPDTFERLVEEVRAVTVDDVHDVARQYLRPDALRILVVGNGEEVGDQLQTFGDVEEIDISIPPPPEEQEE
ncbi:MAG: pitrilysin family protein [Pseudohongiellaceae bacterium]